MPGAELQNVNVAAAEKLPPPDAIRRELPLSPRAEATVAGARETLQAILARRDPRRFVVVGPCSIHDLRAAARVRRAARRAREAGRAHAVPGDARLLREAAHHGGLEGPDQRPRSRRLVPHREGHSHRAAAAARSGGARAAGARPRRSTRSCRSTSPSSWRGRRSARAPPNRRRTARWRAGSRRRSASRTAPTARSASRSTRSSPCATRTTSSASRPTASSPCFARAAMRTRTSCCAAAAAARTTTPPAWRAARRSWQRRGFP